MLLVVVGVLLTVVAGVAFQKIRRDQAQSLTHPDAPLPPAPPGAVRWLDQRAATQPFPIPQEPDRITAARADRRAWYRRSLPEAFDRVGRTDAPWAPAARQALQLRSDEQAVRTGLLNDAYALPSDAALATGVAAGSDDPMVRYSLFLSASRTHRFKTGSYLGDLRPVVAAVWGSRYPAIRKLHAAFNFLAGLRAPGVDLGGGAPDKLADEDRVWAGRFWELFDKVCRDPDPLIQGDLIDIAGRYQEVQLGTRSTRSTRERAYAEVVEHLERAGAPEYTRLTVRGHFLIKSAWDARGEGVAATVTPEGHRLHHERLAEAEAALVEAHRLAPDRPEAPTEMLSVCLGLGHARPEMEEWFGQAMRADPDNVQACAHKLEYLHPKWYGSEEEYLGFGWQCVKTGNTTGMVVWTPIPGHLLNVPIPFEITAHVLNRANPYYSEPKVWCQIHTALDLILREHPEKTLLRGTYIRLACVAGKFETARRELAAVSGGAATVGLGTEQNLAFYQKWAETEQLPNR